MSEREPQSPIDMRRIGIESLLVVAGVLVATDGAVHHRLLDTLAGGALALIEIFRLSQETFPPDNPQAPME